MRTLDMTPLPPLPSMAEVAQNFAEAFGSKPARSPEPPPPQCIEHDMPAARYHADPCKVPSLSSSIAKILHAQSPAHAWAAHPRLGRLPRESTPTLDDGQILHALILNRAELDLEIVEADNFKTKAAQHARDAAKIEGRTPITRRTFDRLSEIVEKHIRPQLPDAFQNIDPSKDTELSIFWEETTSLGEVIQCRGRVDLMTDEGLMYDLKGTVSAHPEDVNRSIERYGYAIQQAAYHRWFDAFTSKSRPFTFTFLFIEHTPPYVVTPVELSEGWQTIGRQRWERAVDLWAACLGRGRERTAWPAYGSTTVSPPSWVVARELGRGANDADREVA